MITQDGTLTGHDAIKAPTMAAPLPDDPVLTAAAAVAKASLLPA